MISIQILEGRQALETSGYAAWAANQPVPIRTSRDRPDAATIRLPGAQSLKREVSRLEPGVRQVAKLYAKLNIEP
jgi:hypothetical protein